MSAWWAAAAFLVGSGVMLFAAAVNWPREPEEPKDEWVNVNPDGRGGGVWINSALSARPFPVCTEMSPATPPPPPSPEAANSARPSWFAPPAWVLADKAWLDEGAPLDVAYLSDGAEILRHGLTLGEDVIPAERKLDMPHPTMRIVRRRGSIRT